MGRRAFYYMGYFGLEEMGHEVRQRWDLEKERERKESVEMLRGTGRGGRS